MSDKEFRPAVQLLPHEAREETGPGRPRQDAKELT